MLLGASSNLFEGVLVKETRSPCLFRFVVPRTFPGENLPWASGVEVALDSLERLVQEHPHGPLSPAKLEGEVDFDRFS